VHLLRAHSDAPVDGFDVADGIRIELCGVGLIGVHVHIKAEVGMHADEYVAEGHAAAALHPDRDGIAITHAKA
jgi:hypothetical protein